MATDPATLLASVETAIADITLGKVSSYTLQDGTVVTRLNLQVLMDMRRTLIGEVQANTQSQGAMFEPVAFGSNG